MGNEQATRQSTVPPLAPGAVYRLGGAQFVALWGEAAERWWLSYWSSSAEKPTGMVAYEHMGGNLWREVFRNKGTSGDWEFTFGEPMEIDPSWLQFLADSREDLAIERRFRDIMADMGWGG